MNKDEVYVGLREAGLLSNFKKDSELWQRAFSLYNETQADIRDKVGTCCPDNFKRVKKWLES